MAQPRQPDPEPAPGYSPGTGYDGPAAEPQPRDPRTAPAGLTAQRPPGGPTDHPAGPYGAPLREYDTIPGYDAPSADRSGYPGTDVGPSGPSDDPWPSLDEDETGARNGRSGDAATPFRRRKGGLVKRFGRLPVAIVAAVLVLGLLVGGGFWLWSNQQGGADGGEYFADLSVSSVIGRVEKNGFECIPGRTIAQCEKGITGADLSVTVHFNSETEVSKIEASGGTAAYSDDEASPEDLKAFFAMAAQLPHSGDPGAASKAKVWVGERAGEGGTKTFGAVRYESAGDQPLVTMSPA